MVLQEELDKIKNEFVLRMESKLEQQIVSVVEEKWKQYSAQQQQSVEIQASASSKTDSRLDNFVTRDYVQVSITKMRSQML